MCISKYAEECFVMDHAVKYRNILKTQLQCLEDVIAFTQSSIPCAESVVSGTAWDEHIEHFTSDASAYLKSA